MMKVILKTILPLLFLTTLVSCDFVDRVEQKAAMINKYEKAALNLAKENRALQMKISSLKYEIQGLKSKNNFLTIQLEKKRKSRGIASVRKPRKGDMVKYGVYKWTPSQLLTMAEKEFTGKNFNKSAQYFHAFAKNYPNHKGINDQFLFQAGLAAYESGKHNQWAVASLNKLITEHPTSSYYRGAKLWLALTNLRMGKKAEFFQTVEEFRKKYRNTPEWKIMSVHYEDIVQKYK